ncbi:MAG: putative toxin-antitoxin system toxin component, PIN family [Thiobacillus sp.]
MRVLLDSNALASALATRGLCAELFEGVLAEHDLLTCQAVLVELARTTCCQVPHTRRIGTSLDRTHRDSAELITQTMALTTPVPDPDDAAILSAARAGDAACFVTGDKALLELGEVATMPILSPRQYWERFHLGR